MEIDFTAAIEPILIKHQISGAVIAVRMNGDRYFESGIGYQNLDRTVPIPTDASFYIYSVTKTLMASVTLDLVGQGKLNLDRPALPSLDSRITLRHLLSHTSGLPDYGGLSEYSGALQQSPTVPWISQTFLNLIQDLRFAPGTDWAYSNIGYLVLRGILEQTSGLSMQELLDQAIFSPLKLQKTFVPSTLEDATVLTPGYTEFFGGLKDMSKLYHPGWVAHGVVISTVPELAAIIDDLFCNQIDRANQMRSPIHVLGQSPFFEQLAYGLGLFIDVASNNSGHTGEGHGYSVAAFHFPNLAGNRTTIAAVTNRDKANFGLVIVRRIAELLRASL